MSGTDDDHGVSQVTDLRERSCKRKCKRRSSKKKKTNNNNCNKAVEVARCEERLFPSDLKHYFPSPVNSFEGDGHDYDQQFHFPYAINHTYPEGMKEPCLKIVRGMRLEEEDVLSLLSNGGKRDYLVRNNGVKVPVRDCIAGKYLVICCFSVPLLIDNDAAGICRAMISAYSQLKNFEMVMVAKMTSATMIDDDEEGAFNRFFDAFPCLAIPFPDSESRDFVCKSLGLTDRCHAALVLDPDRTVLQIDGNCFFDFGASAFPFTTDRLDSLAREDEEIMIRLDTIYRELNRSALQKAGLVISSKPDVSLVELLGSDILLWKSDDIDNKVSVTDLSKKKCVCLYLCYDGTFMKALDEIHQENLAKNLEFEIVLVHIPFRGDTTPFLNAVKLALEEKHKISSSSSSWWVMPFVDEVSRKLWRLCDQDPEDRLIILADGGGELMGKAVMQTYDRYPFTRKSMLDDRLSHLRSLTLMSLLGVKDYELLCSKVGVYVPVSKLKGRNVLLYVDWYGDGPTYRMLLDSYKKIRKDYPHTKVVFVPLDKKCPTKLLSDWVRGMPWLRLPCDAAIMGSVTDRLLLNDSCRCTTLVAFGADGLIRSRRAQDRLKDYDGVSLFADTLFQEIVEDLHEDLFGSY